ncbi:S1 family peptidase [Streptomyces sp. NPDC058622]|uniref:S1 family peptidase n=1 Tax=Streptomyces sp. NPDC058622 TaxID=3346562 RepID=UPI00364D15C2
MSVPRPRNAWIAIIATIAVATGLLTASSALAAVGTPAAAGQYTHTARLTIGDEANGRACSAVVVDASWVLTAASCLAGQPGEAVPVGKPKLKSTATFGTTVLDVVRVVPRADRDVVLAKLSTPVTGITPIKLAPAQPAADAAVSAAGFGRTRTDWVPGKVHTAAFRVISADATTLALTSKGTDSICQGDAGGPLVNGNDELAGINSRSWQGGCLGTPATETRTNAIAARADDLKGWIAKATAPPRPAATVGVYRPNNSMFYVADRNGNLAGWAGFGAQGDLPLTGDWNRDGKDTFGVYRPETKTFFLSNDNGTVAVERAFGQPGDVPVAGDWNGDGTDSIGVYRPGNRTFYLTNDNLTITHTLKMGSQGDVPMVGDWNGDGTDTVGFYRTSDTTFRLSDSNTQANIDHQVKFGNPGDKPIKGDWNGDGTDKIGIYRPSESGFYGAAKDSDTVIYSVRFGNPTDTPITGQW